LKKYISNADFFTADIIFECIKLYVPKKNLSKIKDPEYYNKEIKRHTVQVREL